MDRAQDLVAACYGRINKVLLKLLLKSISNQEALQMIFEEHKNVEKQLKELLVDSLPSNPQPTTSSLQSI